MQTQTPTVAQAPYGKTPMGPGELVVTPVFGGYRLAWERTYRMGDEVDADLDAFGDVIPDRAQADEALRLHKLRLTCE